MPRVISDRDIYSLVSCEQIFKHYFPQYEIGRKYSSPFRDDPCPSFQIKYSSDGNLYWKDYGFDHNRFDPASLISLVYDIPLEEAFNKIRREIIENEEVEILKPKKIKPPVKSKYQYFVKDEMDSYELEYWGKLYVDKNLLEFLNIHGLKMIARRGKSFWKSTPENPAFIYLYKEDYCAFKAYRPLDPNNDKFRGQCNGSLIEGWEQLPRSGEVLVITSSYKDTAVTWRCGIPACNPTSENSLHMIEKKIPKLNLRFKKIYIIFDNDRPGRRFARKLQQMSDYRWTPIFMENFKDPSDSIWETGSYFNYLKILSKYNVI